MVLLMIGDIFCANSRIDFNYEMMEGLAKNTNNDRVEFISKSRTQTDLGIRRRILNTGNIFIFLSIDHFLISR
jgi:hypothetical protein